MTTTTAAPPTGATEVLAPRRTWRLSARRVLTLARAETTLLLRNRTMLFNAVMLAPATVGLAVLGGMTDALAEEAATQVSVIIVTMLVALALLVVVYYNLTTAFVARREELVLKRLLTGETTLPEVLAAGTTPALVVMFGQLVLGLAAMALWFEMPSVTSPLLVLVAVLVGTYVFAVLAVVSAARTRSVESAQLTTLPVLGGTMLLSGLTLPLDLLPDALQTLATWTPLHPVVELMRLGLGGSGDALQPIAVLGLWAVLGTGLVRAWMRIEPRR